MMAEAGRREQGQAGEGSKERQARASKQVGRGMKQRSKEAGKGRLGHWQVSSIEKQRDSHAADVDRQAAGKQVPGKKHKILVEYWLMLAICKHDTHFDCASCSIDW
jgi:hypothetical protein